MSTEIVISYVIPVIPCMMPVTPLDSLRFPVDSLDHVYSLVPYARHQSVVPICDCTQKLYIIVVKHAIKRVI